MNPFIEKCIAAYEKNKSFVCVGLDPELEKLPPHLPKTMDGLTTFCQAIIEATHDSCIAYKPNISFFEAYGLEGLAALKNIMAAIPSHIPIILDAKRGDIGNTSKKQAAFIFDYFNADATTLHPYMGYDSVQPFLEYKDKFNFILCLTSNPSAQDFEKTGELGTDPLYLGVAKTTQNWHQSHQNCGLVVGATHASELTQIRQTVPDLLFLIPGVGAQGGDYHTTAKTSLNSDSLTLINMSRSILYHDSSPNFAASANQYIQTVLGQ